MKTLLKAVKKLDGMENAKRKKSVHLWFSFPDVKLTYRYSLKQFEKFMILKKHKCEKSTEPSVDNLKHR